MYLALLNITLFYSLTATATGQVRQSQPSAVQGQQQNQQNMNIMQGSQPSGMPNTMTGQQSFPGQTPLQRTPSMNQVGLVTSTPYNLISCVLQSLILSLIKS